MADPFIHVGMILMDEDGTKIKILALSPPSNTKTTSAYGGLYMKVCYTYEHNTIEITTPENVTFTAVDLFKIESCEETNRNSGTHYYGAFMINIWLIMKKQFTLGRAYQDIKKDYTFGISDDIYIRIIDPGSLFETMGTKRYPNPRIEINVREKAPVTTSNLFMIDVIPPPLSTDRVVYRIFKKYNFSNQYLLNPDGSLLKEAYYAEETASNSSAASTPTSAEPTSVVNPLAAGSNSSAASAPSSVAKFENPLAASSSTSVKNTAALSTIENPLASVTPPTGSAAANWGKPQKPCKKGSSCSVQGGSRKKQRKSRRHKSKKQCGRSRKSLRKTLRKTH